MAKEKCRTCGQLIQIVNESFFRKHNDPSTKTTCLSSGLDIQGRNWTPITPGELEEFGRRIDYEYVFAPASEHAKTQGGTGPSETLYSKMGKLQKRGFTNFGGPVLHRGELVILMIRPRRE